MNRSDLARWLCQNAVYLLAVAAAALPASAEQALHVTHGVCVGGASHSVSADNPAKDVLLSVQQPAALGPAERFTFWAGEGDQTWDVDGTGLVVLDGPGFREQHFPYHRLYLALRDSWAAARVGAGPRRQTYGWDYFLDGPVWPLVLVRVPKPASPYETWRYWLEGAQLITLVDVTLVDPQSFLVFGLDGGLLTTSVLPRNVLRETDLNPRPPGHWTQRDTMAWPNTQPFRVLPSTKHWYFLTADGKLWQTPRQGEPNREVKEVWAAGDKTILGTIIDHDLNRSFVFGDGWYLDLGDEMKTVTEPADKPWPRPAADAPEIERLRVWRGWVDLAGPPAAVK